jgi:hypothetical protein
MKKSTPKEVREYTNAEVARDDRFAAIKIVRRLMGCHEKEAALLKPAKRMVDGVEVIDKIRAMDDRSKKTPGGRHQ